MDAKDTFYRYYRSKFKGTNNPQELDFGAKKIKPILTYWISDFKRQEKIVDLGCGAGELLLALNQMEFNDLHGCDISAEQIELSSPLFPHVKQMDALEFLDQFPEDSLGVITCFDLLEHLSKDQVSNLIRRIYAKLKPDGIFIAHTPNGISPFAGSVMYGDLTHEWFLTPQSARNLCTVHGFTNFEAIEHLGESKSLAGFIRKMLWSVTRWSFQLINAIETGHTGGSVWTRNFAFKANKPRKN